MPTMVELPQVVSPTVSSLQPIQRPVEGGGLSSFLQDVLPAINEAVKTDQEAYRDYNLAQGRNDELNNVQRSVGFLDAKYYNMGKEFQRLNSTQLEQDKMFESYVDDMVAQGADADTIWDKGREYLRNNSDLIYQSNLDNDVKKGLYENEFKRQLAYQKVVNDKIAAAQEQRFTFDRNNRVAGLYKELSSAQTADEMDLKTHSYIEKAQLAYVTIGGMNPEQAQNAIEQDLIGLTRFWRTQLQDPTAQNAGTALQLKNFIHRAIDSGYLPMNAAIELNSNAAGIEANILDNNAIIAEKRVEQNIFKWDTDPSTFNMGDIQDNIDEVQIALNRGDISPETALRLQKRLMNYGADRQQKLINASEDMSPADMVATGVTLQQWVGQLGNSEDSYIKNWEATILNANPNDTTAAGIAMFNKAIVGDSSGFALRALATKAGNWLSGNVLSTISMSDSELINSDNGKQRLAQYQQLQKLYQTTVRSQPDMADALLEGFPTDKREIVRRALEQNRTVGDLRNDLKNAPVILERQKFAREAIGKLEFKDLRGGFFENLLSNNPSGSRTAIFGTQQAINRNYAALVRSVATQNLQDLSEGMTSNNTDELTRAIKDKRMIVPSETSGYSAVIMPPKATQMLTQRYQLGSSTQQYVVRAIDSRREEIIKQTGVDKSNVIVNVDSTGKYVNFNVYDNEGRPHRSFPHGISMNLADLDKRVNTAKKASETKKAAPSFNTGGMGILGTARIPTAPIGKVAVPFNGKQTTVQYSAAASQPFGGNAQLTKIMLDHWVSREGFVSSPTQSGTPASGGQRSVSVIGLGTNLNAHSNASDGKGSTWGKRFNAAAGNPQAVMNVTSDFIAQHHKALPEKLRAAGIPVPSTAPYDRKYISSVMAISDAMWLSPSTGDYMVRVLKQPNVSSALSLFRQNAALNAKQKDGSVHPRTRDFIKMIESHYRNK